MSAFSTRQVFGPVSISKLKDKILMKEEQEGYLPWANVVFWMKSGKQGPSIQNALLTAINRKSTKTETEPSSFL